ncbi:Sulfhydryl Oxidase 1 [Manis pentadactyla]|nr:Sulfhydryl Oxidase 1 [Manis pentadactyla]
MHLVGIYRPELRARHSRSPRHRKGTPFSAAPSRVGVSALGCAVADPLKPGVAPPRELCVGLSPERCECVEKQTEMCYRHIKGGFLEDRLRESVKQYCHFWVPGVPSGPLHARALPGLS